MCSPVTLASGMSLFPGIEPVKKEAGRRIWNAWLRSRSTIDMLRKGQGAIAGIPHKKFHAFCADLLRYRLRKEPIKRFEELDKLIEKTVESRADKSLSIVPLCLSAPKYGVLPSFQFVEEDELGETCSRWRHIYLTSEAFEKWKEVPQKTFENIQEAHAFVKQLHAAFDLLALNNTKGGCYARANMIIDLLHLCGVPFSRIAKQFLYVPKEWADGPMENWRFHIAVLLFLNDGTKCIIDPSLHADCAFRVEGWIDNLMKEDTPLENDSAYVPADGKSIMINFDPKKALTFASLANVELEVEDDSTFSLSKVYLSDDTDTLETLAGYRFAKEAEWLEDAFLDLP